jgi:hypothetical protein
MSETPRDKTEAKLYDAIASFNETACWDILRLAQMRQYLAEHLANALVPSWLHERKCETAGEEIAHVLLMFGLFPPDWVDAFRAEVLAADGQAYDGELAMYRELVRTLRAVARPDDADMNEVRRLLHHHAADDAAAREQGKSSHQADATPDFFQPGHTYTREHHGCRIEFRVTAIDTSPDGEQRLARGWRTDEHSDWESTDSDDLSGWTDSTEAGA